MTETRTFESLLWELLRLDLDPQEFVIVGGGVLASLGLRDTHDLDIVASPYLWKDTVSQRWPDKIGPAYIGSGLCVMLNNDKIQLFDRQSVQLAGGGAYSTDWTNLMANAELRSGLYFQSTRALRSMKRAMGRPKDERDALLLEAADIDKAMSLPLLPEPEE